MTRIARCPLCTEGPLTRHGSRTVDIAYVENDGLRWERTVLARMMCRACGRTSAEGGAEADALMDAAKGFVCDVYARQGMDAAVGASGVTDRTVERWVSAVTDERLSGTLPSGILVGVLGRFVLVSDAGDGSPLDAAPGDVEEVAEMLARRGGDVEVAWIWPSMRIKEAVERTFPDAELRMPPEMARERLDALLRMLDVPGGPGEARLLSERVASGGWDDQGLRTLQGMCRSANVAGDSFLTLWRDEILAGFPHAGPGTSVRIAVESSLGRLRAVISLPASVPARDASNAS